MIMVVAVGIMDFLDGLKHYGDSDYPPNMPVQVSAAFLILLCVTVNLIIFFKGWRLLKRVKNNYIDEVMASFD